MARAAHSSFGVTQNQIQSWLCYLLASDRGLNFLPLSIVAYEVKPTSLGCSEQQIPRKTLLGQGDCPLGALLSSEGLDPSRPPEEVERVRGGHLDSGMLHQALRAA